MPSSRRGEMEVPLSRADLPSSRPFAGMGTGRLGAHTVTHSPSVTLTDRVGHVSPGQGHPVFPGRVGGLGHAFATSHREEAPLFATGLGHREAPVLVNAGGRPRHAHLVNTNSGFSGWSTTLLIIAAVCLFFPVLLIGLAG